MDGGAGDDDGEDRDGDGGTDRGVAELGVLPQQSSPAHPVFQPLAGLCRDWDQRQDDQGEDGVRAGETPGASMRSARVDAPAAAHRIGRCRRVAASGTALVGGRGRLTGKKIIDVRVLQRPTGNDRDDEINDHALPRLRQQALAAQSALIDGVSGATVTSAGYRGSPQATNDAAHPR